MQGISIFVKVYRIFPSQKQWWHKHPLFPVIILTLKTLQGDEIMRRSPNFVTLLKNKFSRPRQCSRPKWLWPMPRSLLYRFQYWKKSRGNHKKVRRKKIFSLKSMTKLEALTVLWRLEIYVHITKSSTRVILFSIKVLAHFRSKDFSACDTQILCLTGATLKGIGQWEKRRVGSGIIR